jgi:Putative peptidoglycan binding domain
MKQIITTFVLTCAFIVTVALAPAAQAVETTATSTATTTAATTTIATSTATTTPAVSSTIAGLMAQLAKLTTLYNELRAKIMGTQAEIKELRADIRAGMTDADIKTIQELLASDPTIYPKGLVTGYFGPMTTEAIKKFQMKNGLEVTGEVNAETKAAMDAIIAERKADGKFPVGLLLAPGLKQKFEDKLKIRCEKTDATAENGALCEKVKTKYKFEIDEKGRMKMKSEMEREEDDDEDDEDDDSDEDDDEDEDEDDDDSDEDDN